MKSRAKIFTYGCQMNDLDSQKMYSELSRIGYLPTGQTREADIIVINTCSVRQKAYEKAISNLGRLGTLKRGKPSLVIVVAGCVAQQEGERLRERMPLVDIVLGTHQLHRLPELIEQVRAHPGPRVETGFTDCIPSMDIVPDPVYTDHPHRSFINIMQGCDNYCSYCIVPYVRGREISRDSTKILEEVRIHAERGVKEIFLLGQNVNSYTGGMDFPELLRNIHRIEGIERIRFTTSHPKDVSGGLISCFRDLDRLCSHIHLPFQSGSDRVLAAMNRHYTHGSYLELISRLRDARPDIALSSDVMVGFPSETQGDFKDTLDLMEAVRFDVLYSFKYSVRPGTAAAALEDDITPGEKAERLMALQTLQKKITMENNRNRVGRSYAVLVDGTSLRNPDQVHGRTSHNTIVNFPGERSLVGRIAAVRITRANQNSLTGEIVP